MSGADGPSSADARDRRRCCCSFEKASDDLCDSLALVAKKICTKIVDPKGLFAFVAGRLITLGKNPGVRPIGVGEISRRIIGKAMLSVICHDIQDPFSFVLSNHLVVRQPSMQSELFFQKMIHRA